MNRASKGLISQYNKEIEYLFQASDKYNKAKIAKGAERIWEARFRQLLIGIEWLIFEIEKYGEMTTEEILEGFK